MHYYTKHIITFLILLICPIVMMADGFTVVLDAGHGGKDPGAIGSLRSNQEKNINLAVVKEVGRLLSANNPDIKVVYTRSTDIFVELGRRAEIANNANANLFVSVHVNAVPKGSRQVTGVQTYTLTLRTANENLEVEKRENSVISLEGSGAQNKYKYNDSSEAQIMWEIIQENSMKESVRFAKNVQNEMVVTGGRKNMGVRQANLAVLRLSYMPAVLLEIGYISTPSEEQYLLTTAGQNNIAKCIYNAIVNYKKSK